MFHKEFYPTSTGMKNIIKEKINRSSYNAVLDPSAGKGDLLEIFKNYGTSLYGIEIVPELRSILLQKKISIVGYDFFAYNPDMKFDLVLMNPPFSVAGDHLLRVLELFKDSDVVAIMPTTFFNRSTAKSKLVKNILATEGGTVEDVGAQFIDSERPTSVEVSVCTLFRDKSKREGVFEPASFNEDSPYETKRFTETGLVKKEGISQLVSRYQGCLKAFEKLHLAKSELTSTLPSGDKDFLYEALNRTYGKDAYNYFNHRLKRELWGNLFSESKFRSLMTTKVRDDFDALISSMENLAFTEENIQNVFGGLIASRENIYKENIGRIFDHLTKYYKENRCHIEGWKTNDRWKVKRKFILPWLIEFQSWGWSSNYGANWQTLDDIDIALCCLTGKSFEDIRKTQESISEGIHKYKKDPWSDWEESTFFKFKAYKKGTIHFEFRDQDLWNKFNRVACKDRNWLPE